MKIGANSIGVGTVLLHDGKLMIVTKQPEHTKPGKGPAYVQLEMKDLKTGVKINERLRSADTVEKAFLEQVDHQFLYFEGENVVLMNLESYDQVSVARDLIGEKANFLVEDMIVKAEIYEEEILNVTLPEHVIVLVTETEPVIKGQTVSSSFKPAKIENGLRVMVPPFVSVDDRIVVRTSDSTYVERAK